MIFRTEEAVGTAGSTGSIYIAQILLWYLEFWAIRYACVFLTDYNAKTWRNIFSNPYNSVFFFGLLEPIATVGSRTFLHYLQNITLLLWVCHCPIPALPWKPWRKKNKRLTLLDVNCHLQRVARIYKVASHCKVFFPRNIIVTLNPRFSRNTCVAKRNVIAIYVCTMGPYAFCVFICSTCHRAYTGTIIVEHRLYVFIIY